MAIDSNRLITKSQLLEERYSSADDLSPDSTNLQMFYGPLGLMKSIYDPGGSGGQTERYYHYCVLCRVPVFDLRKLRPNTSLERKRQVSRRQKAPSKDLTQLKRGLSTSPSSLAGFNYE